MTNHTDGGKSDPQGETASAPLTDDLAVAALPPPVTTRKGDLPILPQFLQEVLPLLLLWWGVMMGLFVSRSVYFLDIALVGTPTILMLWPVGRRLGRRYFSYRTPAWFLAIATMWIIPVTGLVFTETGWSFNIKSAIFFTLPPVIAFGGILVSLPWAQARPPIRMFFRPDLLFGDGRVFVGGLLMLALGMRYLFAPHPPDDPWALPSWDWFSLAFGISGGIIPIVLMRGMMKLVQRLMRLRDGMFTGYASIAFREWFLLLNILVFGFAFHHVFVGRPVFSTADELSFFPITQRFWVGIGLMGAAAWWMVFVKGGIKKLIGEPFFFETFLQTLQKQLIFAAGLGLFFYGYMSMLSSVMFGRIQPWDDQAKVGLGFLATGIAVLTIGRAIAQYYQRQGMLAHFAAAIVPTQTDRARERLMWRILEGGLVKASPNQRRRAWQTMHRAWDGIDPDERSLMAWTVVATLATMPQEARQALLHSQAEALAGLEPGLRQRATEELRRALAGLEPEERARLWPDFQPVVAQAA